MSTGRQRDSRPPGFRFRRSTRTSRELCCESVSLASLAEQFGTPLYVYSATTIRKRFQIFDRTFRGVPHTVCYSLKANPNLAILKLLAAEGCGFDVVSGGELERVLTLGRSLARRVVFSGVGKTAPEMDLAIRSGILLFNVESEGELHALAERAARQKKKVRFALRVNPDVSARTHPYIATGLHQHKFGVPMQQALALYREASRTKYLQISGVSVHIGSQITEVAPFRAAMTHVARLVRTLQREGHDLRYVDAGGGLGILDEGEPLSAFSARAAAYARAVATPLKALGLHLLLEPGRSIVGPAGALLTRVVYTKTNNSKRFAIVDAAMNDLLRPSLYGAYHEIVPVLGREGARVKKVDVVGPVCETGDFFARDRRLPELHQGDLLAVLDTGAYGMSLASNYNVRPRPAEVLVEGRRPRLIRRRESFAELVRNERNL